MMEWLHFSLSAVRFGRIPKREKQRMLLEMQNAMNNMMSNNSQLHSILHGHQSPPLPMETMTSDASSSPSSSSTPDSPSCSSPSSPQCPQDSESVVSMDTNSSSASSCGSDSGEDEAIVATGRQCQDALAFGQQGSPRQGQVSPSPVSVGLEMRCGAHMEEHRESWNCWNNNAVVGGYQPHGNSQRVTNAAFRDERGVYYQQQQQQQLKGAPSGEPSEDSQRQHEFNTQTASSGYSGPTSCVNNRTHLVSNLDFPFFKIHVTLPESQ